MMQDRLGPIVPTSGAGALGILHFVADALKMVLRRIHSAKAHRSCLRWRPFWPLRLRSLCWPSFPSAPLCWGQMREAVRSAPACNGGPTDRTLDAGVLFYFAFASCRVRRTWRLGLVQQVALMGGMRAASQMISYEVTWDGCCHVSLLRDAGTGAMVAQQGPAPWQWGFARCSALIAFFCFSPRRSRDQAHAFDVPEGESEIVGYFVEYSGLRFGMFYLGSFSRSSARPRLW